MKQLLTGLLLALLALLLGGCKPERVTPYDELMIKYCVNKYQTAANADKYDLALYCEYTWRETVPFCQAMLYGVFECRQEFDDVIISESAYRCELSTGWMMGTPGLLGCNQTSREDGEHPP